MGADVKVSMLVGAEVSPEVTVTEVGLRLQVGAVAAPEVTIVGVMLQERLIVPV
jgi:hypothetical protein